MASYAVERFRPELLPGIVALRHTIFQTPPAAGRAYFEWMRDDNPYIEEPPLIVALHDGIVVGMRGTQGTRWDSPGLGAALTLPCLIDSCIVSEHRNSGLFEELTAFMLDELTARGYSGVLNMTPGPENFLASTVSGGFTSVGSFGTLERHRSQSTLDRYRSHLVSAARAGARGPLRPVLVRGRAQAIRLRRRLLGGPRAFGRLDASCEIAGTPDSVTIVADPEPRPAAMAELVARLAPDERLRHVRDAGYFAWRYRNPLAEHCFVYAEREGALVGYAALQRGGRRRAGGWVDIADLEAIDRSARGALLEAVGRGHFPVVRVWTSTLARDVVIDLEEQGFGIPPHLHRYGDRFMLRPLIEESVGDPWLVDGLNLRRLESWDLRLGVAITY